MRVAVLESDTGG